MAELITKSTLVDVCGLNSLVEDRKVDHHIIEAALRFERVLGSALYAALKTAFDADNTLAGSNNERWRNLLARGKGYGEDLLCWTTMMLAYPGLHSEADRSGVYEKTGEDYRSVSAQTLSMHIADARDRMEHRMEMCLLYLENNAATYPEFSTTAEGEQRIDKAPAGGGFIFSPSKRTDNYRG